MIGTDSDFFFFLASNFNFIQSGDFKYVSYFELISEHILFSFVTHLLARSYMFLREFVVLRMTWKVCSFVILSRLLVYDVQLFSVTIYKVGKYIMPSVLSSVFQPVVSVTLLTAILQGCVLWKSMGLVRSDEGAGAVGGVRGSRLCSRSGVRPGAAARLP